MGGLFLQEFTGYQDAQAAWTMATSAGGAIMPRPGDAQAGSARTLVSAIYSRVRADILSCHYPPGEKLLIGPLSQRFDVIRQFQRECARQLRWSGRFRRRLASRRNRRDRASHTFRAIEALLTG